MEREPGYLKGEVCNRDGCTGIIEEHYTDTSCSCHINPPCGHCETSREFCYKCGWDGREEQLAHYESTKPTQKQLDSWERDRKKQYSRDEAFSKKFSLKEKATKIEVRILYHSNSSQKVEGVYPESMTSEEIIAWVKSRYSHDCFGGGRWEFFPGNGRFSWIQYTD